MYFICFVCRCYLKIVSLLDTYLAIFVGSFHVCGITDYVLFIYSINLTLFSCYFNVFIYIFYVQELIFLTTQLLKLVSSYYYTPFRYIFYLFLLLFVVLLFPINRCHIMQLLFNYRIELLKRQLSNYLVHLKVFTIDYSTTCRLAINWLYTIIG